MGLTSVNWVGGLIALAGLALALLSVLVLDRADSTPPAGPHHHDHAPHAHH